MSGGAPREEDSSAQWARQRSLSAEQIDCTTAVVLKILDGKCKMGATDAEAVIGLYHTLDTRAGALFDSEVHRLIALALHEMEVELVEPIHQLRLQAESLIPKPVMKRYKAMLRNELFNSR